MISIKIDKRNNMKNLNYYTTYMPMMYTRKKCYAKNFPILKIIPTCMVNFNGDY